MGCGFGFGLGGRVVITVGTGVMTGVGLIIDEECSIFVKVYLLDVVYTLVTVYTLVSVYSLVVVHSLVVVKSFVVVHSVVSVYSRLGSIFTKVYRTGVNKGGFFSIGSGSVKMFKISVTLFRLKIV